MAARTKGHAATQDTLPGLEMDPIVESTRTPLVAFGKFVKPEMYDVFGEYDLGTLTPAEKAWVDPNKLAPILFDPPKEAELVVDRVALNPYEYRLILRSPQGLARTALSGVLGDNDLDNERIEASKRGRTHALEAKHEAMSEHVGKLQERRKDMKELLREAKTPGYAHKTEERMKELTSAAWLEFKTIIDVIHVQRGWDDEKRKRAETAVVNYLTQGSQRERVGHWWEMIQLADNYLGARIHVFRDRVKKAQELIAKSSE